MDYIETELTLTRLSNTYIEFASQYREARVKYGKAVHNLHIYLVPRQKDQRYRRCSLDRQVLLLLSDVTEEGDDDTVSEIMESYEVSIKAREDYKGLEKLLEAYMSRITVFQSLMRWQRDND